MPCLELEIPCSGLPFDHVIEPSGPSGAAPKGAPCTCGEMIRPQNFFKKIIDFLPDFKGNFFGLRKNLLRLGVRLGRVLDLGGRDSKCSDIYSQ